MKSGNIPRPEAKTVAAYHEEAIAMVDEGIARLLILEKGPEPRATQAGKQLVALLLRATSDVHEELRREKPRNNALRSVLEEATTWPVTWRPAPRDREIQASELLRLGFGRRAAVNVTVAWQDSPGTKWADGYRKFVERAKSAQSNGRLEQLRTSSPDNTAILSEALELSPLSQDPAVLKKWGDGCIRFYEFQFLQANFVTHADWAKTPWKPRKIREKIRDGLKQIAPRSKPPAG